MPFIVIPGTIAADVANAGTFTLGYPTGTNKGTFTGSELHRLTVGQTNLKASNQFSLTFGASLITVTNSSGSTWTAGSQFWLQVEQAGEDPLFDGFYGTKPINSTLARTVLVSLGSPAAASATGVMAATAVAGTANVLVAAVALAVSRALVLVSSNAGDTTQTVTVTGTDDYGVALTQAIALNGTTSVNGTKAFRTVTSVVSTAALAGNLSVGTRDVLGLPVYLPGTGYVLRELQDGATPTAGTFVAGIQTAGGSTATTGDVRGTWAPNAATDGSKSYQLIIALPDPGYLGIPQA